MSEYARYRVRYEQRSSGQSLAALAGLASAAATGIGDLVSSVAEMASRFEQQVKELERGGRLSPLECQTTALGAAPLLRAAAEAECRISLSNATPNLTAATVENAALMGRKRLLVAEGRLLDGALTETLQELGYRITRRSPLEGGLLVQGAKPNGTSATLCVAPSQGALELDLAGFQGHGCLQERQRILDGLRRRGVELTLLTAQRHESPAGGALAQRFGTGADVTARTGVGVGLKGRQ